VQDKTITLPSGKKAVLKPGKGRDLLKAQRLANDPSEIPYALVSILATVDGQELDVDQVLDMDLPDVLKLQEAVTGKAPSPGPNT
jgi:hypothetical protein